MRPIWLAGAPRFDDQAVEILGRRSRLEPIPAAIAIKGEVDIAEVDHVPGPQAASGQSRVSLGLTPDVLGVCGVELTAVAKPGVLNQKDARPQRRVLRGVSSRGRR